MAHTVHIRCGSQPFWGPFSPFWGAQRKFKKLPTPKPLLSQGIFLLWFFFFENPAFILYEYRMTNAIAIQSRLLRGSFAKWLVHWWWSWSMATDLGMSAPAPSTFLLIYPIVWIWTQPYKKSVWGARRWFYFMTQDLCQFNGEVGSPFPWNLCEGKVRTVRFARKAQ